MKIFLLNTIYVICIFLPFTALAEDSRDKINSLEKRLDSVEVKINKILNILNNRNTYEVEQKDNASVKNKKNADKSISSSSNSENENIYSPGLVLDVYAIQPVNGSYTNLNIPSVSYGAMLDNGPLFELSAFSRDNAFKDLAGQPIGQKWTGFLNIDNSGTYFIASEFNTKKANWYYSKCKFSVSIEDKTLFSIEGKLKGKTIIKTKELKLKKGYYKSEIWAACVGVDVKPQHTAFALKLRGPKDRVAKPVTADQFVHLK